MGHEERLPIYVTDKFGYPQPIGTRGRDGDGLSAGQRLTRKNNASLANGRHPATGVGLLEPVGQSTCGDCVHLIERGHRTRTYFKCGLVPVTFGAGTDIRKRWPACVRFESIDWDIC